MDDLPKLLKTLADAEVEFVVIGGFAAVTHGAGDFGYCPYFGDVRTRLGAPTLALLPIGAYKPRSFMQINHMTPEEAAQAHLDVGAHWSLPMHHDTFRLADEGYDEPVTDLRKALDAKGIAAVRFPTPLPGETWSLEETTNA